MDLLWKKRWGRARIFADFENGRASFFRQRPFFMRHTEDYKIFTRKRPLPTSNLGPQKEQVFTTFSRGLFLEEGTIFLAKTRG